MPALGLTLGMQKRPRVQEIPGDGFNLDALDYFSRTEARGSFGQGLTEDHKGTPPAPEQQVTSLGYSSGP